ncbi:MAG: UDP-N-acetylmuramoyl-tripeptide--D-alanyl-D-alanine ligase [Pseudonocardiales bacterium]|nr:UDP-N-acetylmuramoyl-tripeptide--D-alanyl-D-alanine ligase [Pseudonocardiales bacterium]MBV9031968.1 UDP-N-acetylmuramoyl-tripeptide--D-alanyl-D-alanine ligase [Pseudonocardiales bacterium]
MFELRDVLRATRARVRQCGPTGFTQAVISSRSAEEGSLFVALPGETRDGHDYVRDAIGGGAVGVLVSREVDVPPGVTVIETPDTLRALQDLAGALRRRYGPRVVAITGSAGKTTTKDMVAHVLRSRFEVLRSPGSHNNHLGVPLTLSSLGPAHSHAVIEVGTNHKGEVGRLAALVTPDVGVVTNVGYAHIGNFGSQQEIAMEKVSLFDHVPVGGACVINGDDALLGAVTERSLTGSGKRCVSVGFSARNDVWAESVTRCENGMSGVVRHAGESAGFFVGVVGRHFVYSALLAIAVGLENGIHLESGTEALRSFVPPSGRSTLVRLRPDLVVLDDSHNASPDAVLAALSLLAELPGKVKVAVLGEMRELGQQTAELHALVGARAAAVASHLVTVGPDGELMTAAALGGGLDASNTWCVPSAGDALRLVQRILAGTTDASAVLVKGARFTHMERVSLGLGGRNVGCGLGDCRLYIHCSTCPQLEGGGEARLCVSSRPTS